MTLKQVMATFSLYLAITIPIGSPAPLQGLLLSSAGCILLSAGFVVNMISYCLELDDVLNYVLFFQSVGHQCCRISSMYCCRCTVQWRRCGSTWKGWRWG